MSSKKQYEGRMYPHGDHEYTREEDNYIKQAYITIAGIDGSAEQYMDEYRRLTGGTRSVAALNLRLDPMVPPRSNDLPESPLKERLAKASSDYKKQQKKEKKEKEAREAAAKGTTTDAASAASKNPPPPVAKDQNPSLEPLENLVTAPSCPWEKITVTGNNVMGVPVISTTTFAHAFKQSLKTIQKMVDDEFIPVIGRGQMRDSGDVYYEIPLAFSDLLIAKWRYGVTFEQVVASTAPWVRNYFANFKMRRPTWVDPRRPIRVEEVGDVDIGDAAPAPPSQPMKSAEPSAPTSAPEEPVALTPPATVEPTKPTDDRDFIVPMRSEKKVVDMEFLRETLEGIKDRAITPEDGAEFLHASSKWGMYAIRMAHNGCAIDKAIEYFNRT